MKISKRSIFILLFLWSNSLVLLSQNPVSLETLIRDAIRENYQVNIARSREEIAKNNDTRGNAGFLPTAGISAEQSYGIDNSESTYVFGDSITADNARSSSFNAQAEVNWTIFDGFKMFARSDRLGFLYQLGKTETRYFIEQTIADLATAYYRLATERKLMESYSESLEISRYRLRLEKQKREIGSGNLLLYSQALVDFNADSALVVNQERLVKNLEIEINRITQRELQQPVIPYFSDLAKQDMPENDSLILMALENNRELERAKIEQLLAETNVRMEAGDRYPEVSLYGLYNYNKQSSESGFIRERSSHGLEYGFRIRLNLYDGGKESLQLKNARTEQKISETERQDINSNIRAEMYKILNRYESYLIQYELNENSLEAARQSLDIARQQLENGSINGYDFRQTQLSLLSARRRILELMFSIKSAETDIFRLSGMLPEKLLP